MVQGITEFLPVSSSSHLILISQFLNFENRGLSLDVSFHIGSFFAVVYFFKRDIQNFFENKILFLKVLISSVPIMIIGFILAKSGLIEKVRSLQVIGWTTLIFGLFLYFSDKFKLEKDIKKDFSFKVALTIGAFQILSLIPGVSRSGIAITIARILNFKRTEAAKISFLLSIPILAAVSFYGLKGIILADDLFLPSISISSFI